MFISLFFLTSSAVFYDILRFTRPYTYFFPFSPDALFPKCVFHLHYISHLVFYSSVDIAITLYRYVLIAGHYFLFNFIRG